MPAGMLVEMAFWAVFLGVCVAVVVYCFFRLRRSV
jgi:hypothetical protein